MDLSTIKKVHFVGIGGIGMSALARLFLNEKKEVSGTDRSDSIVIEGLRAVGVQVAITNAAENIPPEIDVVIFTDAVLETNPELILARAKGIPTLSYFEALGHIANQYYLIAVAGAHGKTTTTAMLTDVLEGAGLDPTAVVGSLRAKTGSNFRAGKSKYFVVEADEYRRHFLNFNPDILVITNIEADHLDYYKDLADIQSAFRELALRVPEGGAVVCDSASEAVVPVIEGLHSTVINYPSYFNPLMSLKVIGMHNFQNAAAALAVADFLSIAKERAEVALADFSGTWRRFEYKGVMPHGALLYDDYGHHPTEIRVTLKAARDFFKNKRIVVAFHPHLYSRTKLLFKDFARAFADVDEVVIAPIFAAREVDDGTVSHHSLAKAITKAGTPARAADSFEAVTEYLKKQDGDDTVIITMGAGDIYLIAKDLL